MQGGGLRPAADEHGAAHAVSLGTWSRAGRYVGAPLRLPGRPTTLGDMTIATTTTGAYHLAAGEGPALWHLGGLLTFKATSEATGGGLWVQEARGARGYASPMHSHAREDEAFYVLDGEITVYVGDETITATPGSFLWAPRDVPHAYCVESEEARFLALSTGSGSTVLLRNRRARGRVDAPAAPGGPARHPGAGRGVGRARRALGRAASGPTFLTALHRRD